ncbi:MAG: GH116 family glycosyl-hydrolase [Candidatus Sumerlaea chitinivorans]|nr:GH116 family glycosyl-hydrolase [Candidatus Sumerlaea chitinivorans]
MTKRRRISNSVRKSPGILWRTAFLLTLCGFLSAAKPVSTHVSSPELLITGASTTFSSSKPIHGAPADRAALLQHERSGRDFHYLLKNIPSGKPLELELGFAELIHTQPGQRVFRVEANGKTLIDRLDIVAEAGGPHRALIRRVSATPVRGTLDLRFVGVIGDAKIGYVRLELDGQEIVIGPGAPRLAQTADVAPYVSDSGDIRMDMMHRPLPVGMPIGGLGTGSFEILSDGSFTNFTINQNWDSPIRTPRGTFLAVMAKSRSYSGEGRLLRVANRGLANAFANAPPMSECHWQARFPFLQLQFHDPQFPLRVRVETFSPFVPGNAAESSIPCAYVLVELTNPNTFPVLGAVAFSWEDINGRGGSGYAGDVWPLVAAPHHAEAQTTGLSGILCYAPPLPIERKASFAGEYFLGVETSGVAVTRLLHWDPSSSLIPWWKAFVQSGRLPQSKDPKSISSHLNAPSGTTAIVVAACRNLAPGERRVIPFVLTWHMPRYVTLDQVVDSAAYTQRFASALDVATAATLNRPYFTEMARAWQASLVDSNLPNWLKHDLLNAASRTVANSTWFSARGFQLLEAPEFAEGAWLAYERRALAHAFLLPHFPELVRAETERTAETIINRSELPRRVGTLHRSHVSPPSELPAVDALAAFLCESLALAKARLVDAAWLSARLPAFERALGGIVATTGPGPTGISAITTFDELGVPHSLTMPYAGGTAVAGLAAGEELLGLIAAQTPSAETSTREMLRRLRAMRERIAREYLSAAFYGDRLLWRFNPYDVPTTDSTFAAAFAGEWFAAAAGLPNMLPDTQLESALESQIYESLHMGKVPPLAAALCKPPKCLSTPRLTDAWLAAVAMRTGRADAALTLLRATHEQCLAVDQNPWGAALAYDALTGAPLAFPNSSTMAATWAILPAMHGIAFDAMEEILSFDPHIPLDLAEELHLPIFTPTFHGWLDYDGGTRTGVLRVVRVLNPHPASPLTIRRLKIRSVTETLATPITLEPGAIVTFHLQPPENMPH